MTKIQNWMLMVFLSLSMSVWAEVFECKDAQGHIKYQDSECYQTNDTQVINLPSGTFVKHSLQESINQIISYDTAMTAENYKLGLDAYQQQDYTKAFKLISVAANSQHPEAQNMLGEMYLDGQGISKNESIACGWFKRSADLGYVTAQTNLAYSYNEGRGCPKDVYLAKFWYQKAIISGDSRAEKLLAELEKQTAINVEKMQAEAQKYQAVYEKIKSPPLPPIEKSSAVSSTSWLVIFILLAFIVLLTMDRLKKESLSQVAKEFEELKKDIHTPYKLEYYIPTKHRLMWASLYLTAGLSALYMTMEYKKGFTLFDFVGVVLLLASVLTIVLSLRIKKRNIVFTQTYVQLPTFIFFKQKLLSVAYKDMQQIMRLGYDDRFLDKIRLATSKQGMFLLSSHGFANQQSLLMFLYLLELGIKKQLPLESQNGQSEASSLQKQKVNDNKLHQQSVPQTSEKYSQKAESTNTESPPSQNQSKEESVNDMQFKSLLRAIEEQKKTDPLIGAKVGAKEINQQLLHLLRDNKGVHSESMLAVLGTLAGYACQASVRQEFVANQKLPEQGIFMVAKDSDGRSYYFGDYLNKPLAENKYSVWNLAAGAAQSLGVSQLVDLTDIFKYVTTTVGTEAFGVPRFPLEYKSSDLPKDYLKYFWPTLHPIVTKFCPEPNNWPILYGFAIQEAMVLMKDVIKPNDALLIVMECAIPMSKIDIKNC